MDPNMEWTNLMTQKYEKTLDVNCNKKLEKCGHFLSL